MSTIMELVTERKEVNSQLESLVYGSIEIRNKNNRKYIYTHYRKDGILVSKYAGEYSDELHNLILKNSKLAKKLKKRLKEINKILTELNYIEVDEIDDMVAINIDIARRNLVDSIYKQSILEGVATTYSDTETLVNGGIVKNMTISDTNKIVNLKRAWEFIMSIEMANYPTNYSVLCQINKLVEDGFSLTAGRIRSVPVSIGGSTYIPPLPFEDNIKQELEIILSKEKGIDVAVELVLYVMKKQIFLDGNKRTAIIFANHYLITHALGLIVIPVELVSEYKKILIAYYEDEYKKEDISNFIKNKCWIKLK